MFTVVYQEADLGLVPVAVTLERYEAIEFCGRVGGDSTGILVRYPDPSVSFTSAVEVFSTVVSFYRPINTGQINRTISFKLVDFE